MKNNSKMTKNINKVDTVPTVDNIQNADNSKIADKETKFAKNNNFKEGSIMNKKNANVKANAEKTIEQRIAILKANCDEMGINPNSNWNDLSAEQQELLKSRKMLEQKAYYEACEKWEVEAEKNREIISKKREKAKKERKEKPFKFSLENADSEDFNDFVRMVTYCRTKFVADKVNQRQIAKNAEGSLDGKASKLDIIASYVVSAKFEDTYSKVKDSKTERETEIEVVGFRNAEYERTKEILQEASKELSEVLSPKGKWHSEWLEIAENDYEARFKYARRRVSNAVSRELYATKSRIVNVDITDAETVESYKFPNPETTVINKITIETALENANLTKREKNVLKLFVIGYSYKEIADELGIAERTIETHLRNARVKLGERNFRYVLYKI